MDWVRGIQLGPWALGSLLGLLGRAGQSSAAVCCTPARPPLVHLHLTANDDVPSCKLVMPPCRKMVPEEALLCIALPFQF